MEPEALLQHIPKSCKNVHIWGTGLSRLPSLLSGRGNLNYILATDTSLFAILAMKASSCTSKDTTKYAVTRSKKSIAAGLTASFDCIVEKGTLAAIPAHNQASAARVMLDQLNGGGTLVSVWLEQSKPDALTMLKEVGFVEIRVAKEVEVGSSKVIVLTGAKAQET